MVKLPEWIRRLIKPPRKEVRSWYASENPTEDKEAGIVWRFYAFWIRVRTRVFRAYALVLSAIYLALAILLYSNVWYMNLLLWAITIPSFLIMIHYLRLTRNEH